ncbi:uncharacterized protein [Nicotiana sylvestris]|uniref:uncharacterized protein n=1 Tax=Nicotiana sylvestris TaxID=4096 RepID=UPI00388C55E6
MSVGETNYATWYLDSAATAHMTPSEGNFMHKSAYNGSDHVLVGNGSLLKIENIGYAQLPTPSRPLHLKSIFHVPHLRHNLLSVKRLCKDNNCAVNFDSSSVIVKDKASGQTLLQASSEGDVYPLSPWSRYLQGTLTYGLTLRALSPTFMVIAYSDADWAGCPDSRRSTSGFAMFLGSNLISWRAKKQPTVSKSSTEVEYRAIAYTVAETCWIRHILCELGIFLHEPIHVLCDNINSTYMTRNPVFMIARNILLLIFILCVIRLHKEIL